MTKHNSSNLDTSGFLDDYEFISVNFRKDGKPKPPQIVQKVGFFPVLGAKIRYSSRRDVLEFVPAFEEITSHSRGVKPSFGVVSDFNGSSVKDESEEARRARLLNVDMPKQEETPDKDRYVRMGPVGYKRETSVFELSLGRNQVLGDIVEGRHAIKLLQANLVTFEAALKLVIATEFEMEEGDFAVTHQLGEHDLQWFVYSSVSGSPIAQMVFDDFSRTTSILFEKMRKTILHSTCCSHCCESCILLPRTPEFVVRHKLLDKEVLKQRWHALNV